MVRAPTFLPPNAPRLDEIWKWLDAIPDPEMPFLSICDLGIVRQVTWIGSKTEPSCLVVMTPTYSGCPATAAIADDITQALTARGISRVRVETRLSPAWTTAWLSEAGCRKLVAAGVAPPLHASPEPCEEGAPRILRYLPPTPPAVRCPHCGTTATRQTSAFGSTPCKSLFWCDDCRNPFEHFKCH